MRADGGGFPDKGATAELGRQVERLISLRAVKQPPTPELSAWLEGMPAEFSKRLAEWGIIDQRHVLHGKTLLEHLKDFRESLLNKGGTAMHADIVAARVRNVIRGCGFAYFSDVSASAVADFLATCRRSAGRATIAVCRPDEPPNIELLSEIVQAILQVAGCRRPGDRIARQASRMRQRRS